MLDSDQEPSYNVSKNLLLLPRILKLIKDRVDDSTPLIYYKLEWDLSPKDEIPFRQSFSVSSVTPV